MTETQWMFGRREIATLPNIHHVFNIKRTKLQLIFMGDGRS
ncbi:hypothetical protein HMPREF0650_1938 [Hoylesella buccalis ATCC 35310]|uniref:Uncharacterized protein n=1 Tax=Hoylesella buccalis ATCC 35310 TaxID=679190 RepID=D1W7P3_9BACT|nr:hypothetical protein HMPREF0650_1938 [Hoylesella buccalis ATCC 35310]